MSKRVRYLQFGGLVCGVLLFTAYPTSSPEGDSFVSTAAPSALPILPVPIHAAITAKDAQIAVLQEEWERENGIYHKLAESVINTDRLQMLFESSHSLFKAAQASGADFPVRMDAGDALKQRVLRAIDFQNPMLAVKENELILRASVELDPQECTRAMIAMTIYRQPETQDDSKPIARKYMQMHRFFWMIEIL